MVYFTKQEFAEMLACARRELTMRRKVYPRWVASGKMKASTAESETHYMENIATLIEGLIEDRFGSDQMSLFKTLEDENKGH